MAFYLDTSALVKLVVAERETKALREWLASESDHVASDLARNELLRVIRRSAPDRLVAARWVLQGVTLLKVSTAIFDEAGRIDPAELRSLDAIHLAAALDLGDDLKGFVTYDQRLAAAAGASGVHVIAPS